MQNMSTQAQRIGVLKGEILAHALFASFNIFDLDERFHGDLFGHDNHAVRFPDDPVTGGDAHARRQCAGHRNRLV